MRRFAAPPLAAGTKGDKVFIGDLIQLIGDPDLSVARAARVALKALTDHDFGPSAGASPADRAAALAKWKAWWKQKGGK